jgi:hypothetical protein
MSTATLIDDILGKLPPPVKPDVVPYKGVMIYGHKTAGTIQVMDADSYNNWKGYQPGRFGRSATKKAGGKNTCHI